MVSPVTNCRPSSGIAMSTPRRITGSPQRAINWPARLVLSVVGDGRCQLAGDDEAPGRGVDGRASDCRRDAPFQSPSEILSRIRASRGRVGMCSSASARHISADALLGWRANIRGPVPRRRCPCAWRATPRSASGGVGSGLSDVIGRAAAPTRRGNADRFGVRRP